MHRRLFFGRRGGAGRGGAGGGSLHECRVDHSGGREAGGGRTGRRIRIHLLFCA